MGGINYAAPLLWIAAASVALYVMASAKSLRIFLATLSVVLIALAFGLQTRLLGLPDFYVRTSGTAQILLGLGSIPMLFAILLYAQYRRQSHIESSALATSVSAIVIANIDGRIEYSNRAFRELVGATRAQDITGKHTHEFFADEKIARTVIRQVRTDGAWRGEVRARLLNGGHADVDLSASLSCDASGQPTAIVGSFIDISHRHEREKELKLNRELLATLVENIPIILWTADSDGTITLASGSALALPRANGQAATGLAGLAAGASIYELFEDVPRLRQAFAAALSGEQTNFQWQHDGKVFDTHLGPKQSGNGAVDGIMGVSLDITEHTAAEHARTTAEAALKDTELRKTDIEQRLERAQRLEAVGRLTGGIAHDFNNLLTTILGNVDLIADRVDDDLELRRYAAAASRAAERGADLTQRLLSFSRRQTLKPTATNINGLLSELTEMLERTLPETITLETEFDAEPVIAMADPAQLENAVLNLALNARDAMPDGGVLRITTSTHTPPSGDPASSENESTLACIAVADTGKGMTREVRDRAFEPFFTTKASQAAAATGGGTGLGLSMVHGFVTQSNGIIDIDSTLGKGTIIRIFLPTPESAAVVEGIAAAQSPMRIPRTNNRETILVVEDDPDVREFVVGALRRFGFSVLVAADASEAYEAARSMDGIDLLITDVILPDNATGPEVAEKFLERFPAAKVLFTSGYVSDDIVLEANGNANIDLLPKPYSVQDLSDKVNEVLHRGRVVPHPAMTRMEARQTG